MNRHLSPELESGEFAPSSNFLGFREYMAAPEGKSDYFTASDCHGDQTISPFLANNRPSSRNLRETVRFISCSAGTLVYQGCEQ